MPKERIALTPPVPSQPDPNRPVVVVGSPELFEEYKRAGLPSPMPVPTQEQIDAAQRKSRTQSE